MIKNNYNHASAAKEQNSVIKPFVFRDTVSKNGNGNNSEIGPFYRLRSLLESRVEPFCTPEREPYVTVQTKERQETYPIDSQDFRNHMLCVGMDEANLILADKQYEEICKYFTAKALLSNKICKLHRRVALTDEGIEIDLNNTEGECILVHEKGWKITKPKSRFVRSNSMADLPLPCLGGDMQMFRKYFPLRNDDDLKLLIGFALYTLRSEGPYPILNLKGPQGSGKSTATEFIKTLVDPVSCGSRRSSPKNERDLFIAAGQNHILSLDNLSSIKGDLSDALCRLSTGGAFSARKLYSDNNENLIDLCRPLIINGIPDLAQRPDLLNRCILVEFQVPKNRQSEKALRVQFEKEHPLMLGYLLKGLGYALRNIDDTHLDTQARLADFVKWVTAAEKGLGWDNGSFEKVFNLNQYNSAADALSLNPVVKALQTHMVQNEDAEWHGTMTELHGDLESLAGNEKFTQGWPKLPHHLSREMARLEPDLPKVGLRFERMQRSGSKRPIIIKKLPNFTDFVEDTEEEVGKTKKYAVNPELFDD